MSFLPVFLLLLFSSLPFELSQKEKADSSDPKNAL